MTAVETTSARVDVGPAAADDASGDHPRDWIEICTLDRLTPDRGVAALVDGHQIAVFLLAGGRLCAVDNVDPCSGVAVLSRGIVGDVDGAATVASPLYKQRFDLTTGRCLDADVAALAVHDIRVGDGVVVVRLRRG